jgi:hypothetical protein
VKELDGLTIPVANRDGKLTGRTMKHNGCVRVGDESWSFGEDQVDWFMQTFEQYKLVSPPEKVSCFEKKDCPLLKYYDDSTSYGDVKDANHKPSNTYGDVKDESYKPSNTYGDVKDESYKPTHPIKCRARKPTPTPKCIKKPTY